MAFRILQCPFKIVLHYLGEEAVLVHHVGVEVVHQLQDAVEVGLQHPRDTNDREVGVPRCLLYPSLEVRVLYQMGRKMQLKS